MAVESRVYFESTSGAVRRWWLTADGAWTEDTATLPARDIPAIRSVTWPAATPPLAFTGGNDFGGGGFGGNVRQCATPLLPVIASPGISSRPADEQWASAWTPDGDLWTATTNSFGSALQRWDGASGWTGRRPASGPLVPFTNRIGSLDARGDTIVWSRAETASPGLLKYDLATDTSAAAWSATAFEPGSRTVHPRFAPDGNLIVIHRQGTGPTLTTGLYKVNATTGATISGPHTFGYSFHASLIPMPLHLVRDQTGAFWLSINMGGATPLQVVQFDPTTMAVTAGPFTAPTFALLGTNTLMFGGPTLNATAHRRYTGHRVTPTRARR